MIWLLLLGALALAIYIIYKFKIPKLNSFVMITGGVKCGKSTMSVYFALKTIKRNQRRTKFVNFFRRLFKVKELEMPQLYSNVPINYPYVPLKKDHILRKERFAKGSVVYIQEASLFADKDCYKELTQEENDQMLLFAKLFGHEAGPGSCCILDTQQIGDISINFRRSLSQSFMIHHLAKWPLLPFMTAYVREEIYSEDGTSINVYDKDVEDTLKKILIPKWVFKKFDAYCYSILTDHLDYDTNSNMPSNLKATDIVSFRSITGVKAKKKIGVKK